VPNAPPDAAVSSAVETGRVAPNGEIHTSSRAIALPGATGAVSLDYLACDRASGAVWIPAGNTGSVDVFDIATEKVTRIEGFPTADRTVPGRARGWGPSSATLGDGFVYVGNRASSEVCAIDRSTRLRGACVTLAAVPDGMQYVAATKELWVTTPRDRSITVLDAESPAHLKAKTKISFEGAPEGYAVDDARALFYTNLEDKDRTVAVDARTHRLTASWDAHCGSDGPRGLAIDTARRFLMVACTNHVEVLDAGHAGALLSRLDTGDGVDNIDYLGSRQLLYAAAGKAAVLTVARVDDGGQLTVLATSPTAPGARVVVADEQGVAYVGDPARGQVLAIHVSR
jgi:DNA-binding beta-propeller fold protein YncE